MDTTIDQTIQDLLQERTLDVEAWALVAREYAYRIAAANETSYNSTMSAELAYMQQRYQTLRNSSMLEELYT